MCQPCHYCVYPQTASNRQCRHVVVLVLLVRITRVSYIIVHVVYVLVLLIKLICINSLRLSRYIFFRIYNLLFLCHVSRFSLKTEEIERPSCSFATRYPSAEPQTPDGGEYGRVLGTVSQVQVVPSIIYIGLVQKNRPLVRRNE